MTRPYVFLFVGFFFLYQLSFALHPTQFPPERPGKIFLGADNVTGRVLNFLNNQMKDGKVSTDFIKHPLFPIIILPLHYIARELYAWTPAVLQHNLSITFPSALLGALNICLSFWIFMRNEANLPVALAFALLYGLSTAAWFFSSFPDTYVLTALCTTLFFAALLYQIEHNSSVMPVAVMQAVACYASPQQIFLALVPVLHYLHRGDWSRRAIFRAVQYIVILGIAFVIPFEILTKYSGYGWKFARVYVEVYGQWQYLLEPHWYVVVFLNFFVFSVASPVIWPSLYTTGPLSVLQQTSWLWTGVVVLYVVCAATFLWRLRTPSPKAMISCPAIIVFLASYVIFFVFFNPKEAFLYSLPVLFPWLLILHAGYVRHGDSRWQVALGALLVGIIVNNFQMIAFIHSLS